MITCEQCRESLDEYALGHSTVDEATAVAAHLEACSVCRRELTAIEAAWSALPLVLPSRPPSALLFDRVNARIDGERGPHPASVTVDLNARVGRPVTLSARERALSYIVAASVLVGLTIGAASYVQLFRPGVAVADNESLEEQSVRDLAERLGNLQQMERLLASDNVRLVTLQKPQSPDGVRAYVVWDLAANQGHFYAFALPAAPAGSTYQLWGGGGDDHLHPGPTFTVNAEGLGSAVVDLPPAAALAAPKAVVTLEPAGGSKKPTGQPILEATL